MDDGLRAEIQPFIDTVKSCMTAIDAQTLRQREARIALSKAESEYAAAENLAKNTRYVHTRLVHNRSYGEDVSLEDVKKAKAEAENALAALHPSRTAVQEAEGVMNRITAEQPPNLHIVKSNLCTKLVSVELAKPETVAAMQVVGRLYALCKTGRRIMSPQELTIEEFAKQMLSNIPTIDTETILAEYMN